jgi:hypothetical protein
MCRAILHFGIKQNQNQNKNAKKSQKWKKKNKHAAVAFMCLMGRDVAFVLPSN